MMPDMQLDGERIGDFKIAQEPIDPLTAEEIERRQIIEFHEARLNWRLQRALGDHSPGRFLQQPRLARPRSVATKPKGFG
jgi:hypothetical protein